MKRLGFIAAVVTAFILGYIAGNTLPFTGFAIPGKSIEGKAKLEVKLVLDNGQPLERIEVDVGETTGPPAKGGVAVTDENGVATFAIRPGTYVIYFNLSTFPKNLEVPEDGSETKVQVTESTTNRKTIILKTK